MINVIRLHIDFSVILLEVLHLLDMLFVHCFCVSLGVHRELAGWNLVQVVQQLVASCLQLLLGYSIAV